MVERYDVVVIGAGLAGLYMSERLAAAGARVLLADARAQVPGRTHTTGILVKKTLDDHRLPDDCLGPAVRDVRLIAPSGRALHVRAREDAFRVGNMPRIYAHLLAEARRRGARWAARHRFIGSQPTGRGSRVHFATPHGEREVAARLLVGADGARSFVARDLHLASNRRLLLGVEQVYGPIAGRNSGQPRAHSEAARGPMRSGAGAVAAGQPPAGAPPTFHCFLDPTIAPGYIAWVVDDGAELHVGTAGYAGRFSPLRALEILLARVRDPFGIDRRPVLERRGGFIPIGGIHRRIGCRRGLLIGDAAGAVSPLTAGGLDACFRLTDRAVEVTRRALAATSDGEVADTLAHYRGDAFRQRFASRLMMRRLFDTLQHRTSLELGFAAASSPALQWLVRHVFFSRGSFPDIQVLPAPAEAAPR